MSAGSPGRPKRRVPAVREQLRWVTRAPRSMPHQPTSERIHLPGPPGQDLRAFHVRLAPVALTGNSGQSASDRMPGWNTRSWPSLNGYMYEWTPMATWCGSMRMGRRRRSAYTCDDTGSSPCWVRTPAGSIRGGRIPGPPSVSVPTRPRGRWSEAAYRFPASGHHRDGRIRGASSPALLRSARRPGHTTRTDGIWWLELTDAVTCSNVSF